MREFGFLILIVLSLSGLGVHAEDTACESLLLKFRMSHLPNQVKDQCDLGTCWIHQELYVVDAAQNANGRGDIAPKIDSDFILWAHLRRETINSLNTNANQPVYIDAGGSHSSFDMILRQEGALPLGAWPHTDLSRNGRAVDRLTVELAWESRMLRDELNAKEIQIAEAVERIEKKLSLYFGSTPPSKFMWRGREWTRDEFAKEHVLPFVSIANGQSEEFKFPEVYVDEKEMRRHQTAVALHLRQTRLPIRASVRWLDCFEDPKSGLLSVKKWTTSSLNTTWVNKLTHCNANTSMHAILITGYTIKNGEYYFDFVNSWGENWGRKGHGTIDTSYWPFVREAILPRSLIRRLK